MNLNRRLSFLTAPLLAACPPAEPTTPADAGTSGRDDAGTEAGGDAGVGEDAGIDAGPTATLEERCAEEDAEDGVERPEGWQAASHCRLAPPDSAAIFGDGKNVAALTVHITREAYDAMEADLADLMSGGGGQVPPEWLDACTGLYENDPCSVTEGDGICVDDADVGFFCLPDGSGGPPPEWAAACVDLNEFDVCDSMTHGPGLCFDAGPDGLLCIPDDFGGPGGPGGPAPTNPCTALDTGDACMRFGVTGSCVRNAETNAFISCEIREFSAANVDGVPDDSAAPFWDRKPNYVRADIEMAGQRWTDIGLRYKGNNGLASSTAPKRPLRIKADEWEDDTPRIKNQRIFGYQAFSLASNQTDPSFLNQHAAASTFRLAGVIAPRTTPVRVELVVGDDAPLLLGVYTLSEIPDDPLLDEAFGEHEGNLYKPDGRGAHFVEFVEASFHKKTNETQADYTDVMAFVAALQADQTNAPAWRENLEATFDMDAFIRFLAVNQTMANWDTYGGFAHNFYLYRPAPSERLTFIPWDFDLAFAMTGPSDFSLLSFGGEWPLIQAVAHDPVYYYAYHQALIQAQALLFGDDTSPAALAPNITAWSGAIASAVAEEGAAATFSAALSDLSSHANNQNTRLSEYLTLQGF